MKTDLLSVLEAACVAGALALTGTVAITACSSEPAAGCPAEDAGCPAADAGCPAAGGAGMAGNAQTPPTGSESDISAWLAGGDYKEWKCEPAPHDSRSPSPHGINRICSNDILSSHGAGEFPVGAAGVKELYDSEGASIIGYAMYRKVKKGQGEAWYWFEVTDADGTIANGYGSKGPELDICVGCHMGAGSDADHSGHDFVYTQAE